MPLYEYHCNACSHRFERIVKFSDAPLRTCPKCGKEELDQLISAPAVQFKGSGWYVTDYARKSSAGSSPSATKDTSAAASPAPASTEPASTSPSTTSTTGSSASADSGDKKSTSKPGK